MKIGKLEVDLNELAEFIVKAKKNCYAGEGIEQRVGDGSRRLTFSEGNFAYEDNYDGFYQAPGTEIVRWQMNGQRIWQMSYSGGMLPEFWGNEQLAKRTFTFLKKVLQQVDSKKPFRGPDRFSGEDQHSWKYSIKTEGDLVRFRGEENIFYKSAIISPFTKIFSQDYIGGLVIPK
jgi:hypothetical protein